jgi:tetratricopeptide (TPR) repeat protein
LEQAIGFYEQALQLDSNFAVAWARLSRANAFFYFRGGDIGGDTPGARRDAAKRALEKAQKLQPDSPETLLALGFYQYWVLRDYEVAKTTFIRVAKILPGSSEIPYALGGIARRQGYWDESVAYREEALALDPRNVFLLDDTAWTYIMLRQFPAALTLYDRALDIVPNDPVLMGSKASIYQAEGDLEQAAKLLLEINAQTTSSSAFDSKIRQLMLERNLDEPVRLLQARLAQFHFGSESEKAFTQNSLAFAQRLAGDPAAARISAEQAYNTLKPLYINGPALVALLSETYAILGNKDAALKEAERAITLSPSSEDAVVGPDYEENLALIEMIVGEKSRAISTFARLLKTPYGGWLYAAPITPALLRLDPTWDPLRADHTFQKLCEEKPQ